MEVQVEQTFAAARGPVQWARPSDGGVDEERGMSIAPLLETEEAGWSADLDLYAASWPRPALVLVPDPSRSEGAASEEAPAEGLRAGVDVSRRRARRAAFRRRRRAVVLAVLAAGAVCGLALPVASLGGSPVAAHPQGVAVVGETVYVARPGDTLWSIAAQFDHGGDPRPMAEALAREIGSGVVVPGERIPIPR